MIGRLDRWRARLRSQSGGRTELALARLYLKLSPAARFRIYRMLARLMEAEIDARTALEFVLDVVSNDGRNPNELPAIAVRQWLTAYREHGRLADALTGWVPGQEVLLIEAGERAGRFQHALSVMLTLNERMNAIRGQLLSKLAYPTVAAVVLSGVLYYLSTSFLPTILALAPPGKAWSGAADQVIALLTWAAQWLLPSIVGIVVGLGAVFATLGRFSGPVRRILDHVLPWSVHRFTTGVGFFSALLVLMESGRSLSDALDLVRPNASPYLARTVTKLQQAMREGEDFGAALSSTGENFPDLELIKEIQVYSRIGRLEENLLPLVQSWMDTATARSLGQITLLSNIVLTGAFGVLGLTFNGFYDIMNQLTQGVQ